MFQLSAPQSCSPGATSDNHLCFCFSYFAFCFLVIWIICLFLQNHLPSPWKQRKRQRRHRVIYNIPYPFNVHGNSSNNPFFISDISNLPLFLLVRLARDLSTLLIFKNQLWVSLIFLYCSPIFNFTDFCLNLYYFLSCAYFWFNLLFFSSFLR